jgi:hypothetical protein
MQHYDKTIDEFINIFDKNYLRNKKREAFKPLTPHKAEITLDLSTIVEI